jgi:mitochondrial chaperone BCS1
MIPSSFDPSSLLLLILGKDNSWIPYIIIITVIIKNWNKIYTGYSTLLIIGKRQYKLTAEIYNNIDDNYTYGQLDSNIQALLLYIHNLSKQRNQTISNTYNLKLPTNVTVETGNNVVIPASGYTIKLNDNISCKIDIEHTQRDTSRSEKTCAINTTTITFILSTPDTLNTILDFMNEITSTHKLMLENKSNNKLYIVKPHFKKSNGHPNGTELQHPDNIPFKSYKTFDNLFFEQKEQLIKRINTFKARDKYKDLGLPETLGLLFYGDPGTGKTSCIKAIANYLNMSIIIVPMNLIKTKKRLEELFFSNMITIPQDKRIYVFEEIDCNGWNKIVADRSLNLNDTEKKSDTVIIESLSNIVKIDDKKKNEEEDDKLTLGAILEIIDGLVECPGRIIIMTTNHKEHIDSALLRPGRIDMEIEFKRLRNKDIAQIFNKWYGYELYENEISNIPNYKFTQAELSQLLFKYEKEPDLFIKEIKSHF